jgi:ABC-type Fe3+ transport system permease subunit
MTREDIVNDIDKSVQNTSKVKMIENFCVNSLWVMIIIVVISLIVGIAGANLTKNKSKRNGTASTNATSN